MLDTDLHHKPLLAISFFKNTASRDERSSVEGYAPEARELGAGSWELGAWSWEEAGEGASFREVFSQI